MWKGTLLGMIAVVGILLTACEVPDTITGVVAPHNCPLPPPVITDTTATGTFDVFCPYYWRDENDSLRLHNPPGTIST